MSLGSWNGFSSSSALVDSALPGSQDAASLSWTSVSFWANPPEIPRTTIQATRTIHLVTREVSFPAIWRCMWSLHHRAGTEGIGVFPEMPAPDRPEVVVELIVGRDRDFGRQRSTQRTVAGPISSSVLLTGRLAALSTSSAVRSARPADVGRRSGARVRAGRGAGRPRVPPSL